MTTTAARKIAPPCPDWAPERWQGIKRSYNYAQVKNLQGSLAIQYSLAEHGSKRLWQLLHSEDYVASLGALTGNQAMQYAKAGLTAIYISGWQVAADANTANQMYPDQSLYPVDSVPNLVTGINNCLRRADEIQQLEIATGNFSGEKINYYLPLVADAEAGFGGKLNVFELMRAMIQAGAAGVHFEDQLAAEKKCGHLGGKVLIPASAHINTLNAARLAADVAGVASIIICRTDADSAPLITSDIDPVDQPFISGKRTAEGFYRFRSGVEAAIARSLVFAPYADLLWMETSKPDLGQAREFAQAIHAQYPGKMLAYNCSPSFNWARHLAPKQLQQFQIELGKLGFKFQFITLAGFHNLNFHSFRLARQYQNEGMAAYSALQQQEFAAAKDGFSAHKHQREVGVGYFDAIAEILTSGTAATTALGASTEAEQFV